MVNSWTNEANIMKQLYKLSESMIATRMEERGSNNASALSTIFLKSIGEFCLQWLQQSKLSIDQQTCSTFRRYFFEKTNADISIDEALSCILQEKKSFYDKDQATYNFPHKSFQEYMAGVALLDAMEENKTLSLLDILCSKTGAVIDRIAVQKKLVNELL